MLCRAVTGRVEEREGGRKGGREEERMYVE